jgi:hypothetical protein
MSPVTRVLSGYMRRLAAIPQAMPIGDEIDFGNLRIHRYNGSIVLTDLTNAGKRGKRVDEYALYDLDFLETNQVAMAQLERWLGNVIKQKMTTGEAISTLLDLMDGWDYVLTTGKPKLEPRSHRGIDVNPPTSVMPHIKKVVVNEPGLTLSIDAKPNDTMIREVTFMVDKGKRGPYRTDTFLTGLGKKGASLIYNWVRMNIDLLSNVSGLSEIREMLKADNIPYGTRYLD